LILAKPNL